jgi:pimeloyl-ACP methyl ester carboxylesterase
MTMPGTIVGGIILLLALLIGLIWVFGAKAKARLAAQYPPPGQMVDVGGYRMHINCQGDPAGSPTVVMDAGQGEPGLTWASVQPEVAGFTRVCAYDRAGLGWSEASPKSRTASNIVEELHTLLTRADVEPPYVLVGHSAGGLYARLYAHEHPGEVAGMVLVDAAHEDLDVRSPESLVKMNRRVYQLISWAFRFLQMLGSIGLLALVPDTVSRVWLGSIPEGSRETYMGIVCSDARWFKTVRQEGVTAFRNLAAARAARLSSLGDIPLIVLSRGQSEMSTGPGISAEDVEHFNAVNKELQAELAALSSRGKQIIAEESGHYIQVDQPELVIEAIREVVEAARGKS